MATLLCPDCGCSLSFQALTNGQHVCECSGLQCRADFMTVGRSRAEAADKFVHRCERFGYTTSLERRLRALVEGTNDNRPPAEERTA